MEVSERNDPPTIQPISDITLDEDEVRYIDLTIIDEEGADPTVSTSHAFAVVGSDGKLVLTWSEVWIGTNLLTLEISDGINTVYLSFNVTMSEPIDDDDDNNGIDLDLIFLITGVSLAMIMVLLLVFLVLRRSKVDEQVRTEKAEADRLYEWEMENMEE